jgi:hypothetical protein
VVNVHALLATGSTGFEGRRYLGLEVLARARLTTVPDTTNRNRPSTEEVATASTIPALSASSIRKRASAVTHHASGFARGVATDSQAAGVRTRSGERRRRVSIRAGTGTPGTATQVVGRRRRRRRWVGAPWKRRGQSRQVGAGVDDAAGPRHTSGAKLGVALLESAIERAFVPLDQTSESKGLALPDCTAHEGAGG